MGFLQSQMQPELTRRFVLIVRASRPTRVRRLRWRGRCHTVCPCSCTPEKDRLDFHSFIFTAISLIATPSLLLRSPLRSTGVSFALIPGFTLITRSAGPLSSSLVHPRSGQVLGNPSDVILSPGTHPCRANSSRDKKRKYKEKKEVRHSVLRYSICRLLLRGNMKVP